MTHQHEQLVREFFSAMGPTLADFEANYRARMASDVVRESVGLSAHEGIEECIAYLDDLQARTGMEYCTIEILNIASTGAIVPTERLDTMHRADGSAITTFRLMGAIEIRDGKIIRYTDYLDTWQAKPGLAKADLPSSEHP